MKLNEGGQAFKDNEGNILTRSISRSDLKPTLIYISQKIGIPMKSEINKAGKIQRYGLEDLLLGSAAKSKSGIYGKKETMGDIDIAVDEKNYNFDEFLSKIVQKLGSENVGKPMKGMGIIPTMIPIGGDESGKLGYTQVDFMIGNPRLLTFTYKSPDIAGGQSKYNGIYRNILMSSLLQNMRRQVRDSETKEIIALVGPSLLLNRGIVTQWRHFPLRKDGTGRLTTMKAISREEFDELYPEHKGKEKEMTLSGPEDIIEFIFPGANLKSEDIDSFEELRDLIIIHKVDHAENIFNRFISMLESRGLDVPSGLVVESLAKIESVNVLQEVRKHSMNMVIESIVKPKTFEDFRKSCISLINNHKKEDHFTKPKVTADTFPQDGYYYLIKKCGMDLEWKKIGNRGNTEYDHHVNNLEYFYKELCNLIHSTNFFFVCDHYDLKITPESFINGLVDLEPIDEGKY